MLGACISTEQNSSLAHSVSDGDMAASSAMRISVLPIAECHTLQESVKGNNHDVTIPPLEFIMHESMMDLDTSILSASSHIYIADSLRICRIAEDSVRPILLMALPVKLSLVCNKNKHIDSIPDLRTRIIAITRWSQLEHWINQLAHGASVDTADIYQAQINSIPLRFTMLRDSLIDAAILPDPWADSLVALGHTRLCDTTVYGMGLYITPSAAKDSILRCHAQQLCRHYSKQK